MSVNFNMVALVRNYLDRNDWHYEYNSEKNFISCNLVIKCKLKSVRLFIEFNDYGFTNYAICNLNADEDTRMEVLRYITMANYGLRNGNFELDLRDGEVRYKVYTNCNGMNTLPDNVLDDCMFLPPRMIDTYGNGLAAIMMGFSDAKTEIEKVER